MEFDFNINRLFPNAITKLRGQDAARFEPDLKLVLDVMGEASRIAQNLRRPVTVANAFVNSNQALYIMTDSTANKGNGAVVGLLKIGPKKLFLLNKRGLQNELNPMCVLDFYVHESCQRMGLGKILFSHFLEDEKIPIKKMAIDRPSEKFLGFLRKYYGLVDFIPQVNNFVIYDGFFDNDDASNKPPVHSAAFKNSNNLPNRWNSMIAVNTANDDSSVFRTRGNQSVISCLYDQPHCSSNELWRTNSCVNVNRSVAAAPVQPKSFATEAASKFSHHRLW